MNLAQSTKLIMDLVKFLLKIPYWDFQISIVLYEIFFLHYLNNDLDKDIGETNREDTSLISSRLDLLVKDLSNSAFEEIQSIISPSFCIVVRKDSNFGIFNGVLESYGINDNEVYFLIKKNKKYVVNQEISQSYRSKSPIPKGKTYVLTSPWIDPEQFKDHKHLFYTITVKDCITSSINLEISKILAFLNRLDEAEIVLSNGCYAKKTVNEKFSHIKLSFDLIGTIEYTTYNTKNSTMTKLEEISENAGKIRSFKFIGYFMTEVTEQILKLLFEMGVFKLKSRKFLNLKEYPDLIPIIMPYVMVDCSAKFGDYAKLLTVGFDLRGALASNFEYLFDHEKVMQIIDDGGVYLHSRIVYI